MTNAINVNYHTLDIDDKKVFYREAGPKDAPVLLLLHGFPTSSHMFRNLIPHLATEYRVIAPDLLGFGFSDAPDRSTFKYTFENLTDSVDGLIEKLGISKYAMFVFDYGAPVGFRLALKHPKEVTAIITQSGNAYLEGVSAGFDPIKAYWADANDENRNALRGLLTEETTMWQYTHGVSNPEKIAPEAYLLDSTLMNRPGNDEIQLDLFLDYSTNAALYPEFQAYFRSYTPPLLAVWGKNDPFFLPPGAEAFKRDIPDAEINFYDTGHFALESHGAEIAATVMDFLSRKINR